MMKLLLGTTLRLFLTSAVLSIGLQSESKSQALNLLSTKFTAGPLVKDPGAGVGSMFVPSMANQANSVIDAMQTSFGSAVEAMTAFKPFYVTGDFNGDGAQDVVTVVRIKERRSSLAKDVTILNPWGALYGKATFPADPAAKPTLALAIIHGTKAGWQSSPSAGKFLLIGDSPILILNYDRITSGPEALQELMSLIKLGKPGSGQSLPATVKRARKGDVIVLGTEAVNSFLYWNGKTYLWEEEGQD